MNTGKCLLCKETDATKTNSHIVPSFLVANVCSYDGSGKRDKEVMFTITPTKTTLYTGQLPDTKIEEIINTKNLTDERIENELMQNTASKDYIFCPDCESKLSVWLETPYSTYHKSGKAISPDVSFFFWISIIWRMSISQIFGFELPTELENHLGAVLNRYLDCKTNGLEHEKIEHLVKECNISYKILRCPSFLPRNSGFMGAIYSKEYNILSFILGDTIVCVPFDGTISDSYSFWGAEKEMIAAPNNNGLEPEKILEVSEDFVKSINSNFIKKFAHIKVKFYQKFANDVWRELGLSGNIPRKIFKSFMESLLSEHTKLGDRHSSKNITNVLRQTLIDFGILSPQ